MGIHDIISINCFGKEIGRLGYDLQQNFSTFQYNPEFLIDSNYKNLFPQTGIVKKTHHVQVFRHFNNDTFKGLPPMIADSLPDVYGNIIFKKWLEAGEKRLEQITTIEQLTYVANRGMGALEYKPSKTLPTSVGIDLNEITQVLSNVLDAKSAQHESNLNSETLLNIFKIGSSAGGVRPKVLISQHKQTLEIIPGDLNFDADHDHYLVKLNLVDENGYNREQIEYCYYLIATQIGVNMMPSKMIDKKHFATLRFDRQNGKKIHTLTACGLTGWDFLNPKDSSYENLFELAYFLKVPQRDIEQLFKRMVFNVVFCNTDDHLKNHAFLYAETEDRWYLTPAYDLTYSLNPLLNYKKTSRALSINGKRIDVTLSDLLKIAETFTIKSAKRTIQEVQNAINLWSIKAKELEIPEHIIKSVHADFVTLI
jgi:serine/threonine-protein kinase HipA